jgi:lipid-A-disaccharide synthase
MKYYLIAGERSGELHGANLYSEIKKADPAAEAFGIGGKFMEEAGVKLSLSYDELAIMGFWELVEKYSTIRSAMKLVKKELSEIRPDVLILIDYAGFNLRIAKFAKELGIKVFFYISPKIWAWDEGRVEKIRKLVDRMFVILPFEKDFYARHGIEVDYVGNPILDALHEFVPNTRFLEQNKLSEQPIIAVLPGSRKNEIESTLFRMLSILPAFPEHQFVVAAVDNHPKKYYEQFRRNGQVQIVYEQTYDLLYHSEMALVTSGTATLETALFKVPQVVCYRMNFLTYWIAKMLVKIKYISLVNLIADRKVVTELIQDDFTPSNIREELTKIKSGEPGRLAILKGYDDILEKIGKPGASKRAAEAMVSRLLGK